MSGSDNDADNPIDGAAIASGSQPQSDSGVGIGIENDAGSNGDDGPRTTADPPQKRRGGWPKGKPRKPANGAASATDNSSAKPRNSERVDRQKESVLAQQIVAFHQIAAMATRIPELMIDEREAQLLASSIRELSAHYGPVVSGPAMLWVQFVGVAAMIYVPRVPQVALRLAAIRAAKNRESVNRGENVVEGAFKRAAPSDDPFAPGRVGG